jgi:hypothetical protein
MSLPEPHLPMPTRWDKIMLGILGFLEKRERMPFLPLRSKKEGGAKSNARDRESGLRKGLESGNGKQTN